MKKIIPALIAFLFFASCAKNSLTSNSMEIKSPAFANNENIPAKYTCDGDDINPPLQFSDVPGNAKSLVLISDDPDAPTGTWVHWTIWNIDPATTEITENSIPAGAIEGTTSFGEIGYGGPCPPSGVHRYYFKLYALDTKLELPPTSKKEDIKKAMTRHVLASAELIGLYQRLNKH